MDHDTPRSARLLILLVTVGLLASSASAASQPLASYASMVEQYARGDVKGAVIDLSKWGDGRTSEIEESIRRLQPGQWRAAAMLHTDFAGVLVLLGERRLADGQLRIASDVVDLMLSKGHIDSSAQAFAAHWYAFVGSVYVAEGLPIQARFYVERGVRQFPRSPELFIARGYIVELTARSAGFDPRVARDGSSGNAARRAEQLLTSAGINFQQAIDLDPANGSAHLHRGWIFQQLADRRAQRELELALATAQDDGVRLLSHLLLGSLAESRADLDAAAREYEAAKAIGFSQTVCVALSRVEEQRGHFSRAREIVEEYTRQSEPEEDPWWNLRVGGFDGNLLTWLRAEARRP
jgi:tetratricopeptide (TPR) repeat protein